MVLSADRPGMMPERTAEAGGPASPFLAEHTTIIGWLDVLLKGKPEEQAVARTEIAMILEQQGFADDAEEAYWTNVQSRAPDRRAYERLIALYQERRDRLSESLVRRQHEQVFSEGAVLATPAPVSIQPSALMPPSAAPGPLAPMAPAAPAQPVRRLRRARPADDVPAGPLPNPRLALPSPEAAVPRPAGPAVPRARAAHAVRADDVVPAEATGGGRARRRATLLPNPGRTGARFSTGGLIALQPMTILAFLLASFGAAAIISVVLIASDRSGARTAAPAGQVPARCVDSGVRFPGASDPRGAVVAAYRQQGIDVDAPRPGGPRLTAEQAELVVGGWMAASLLLEHAGQPAPSLVEWLDPASDRPTLANAILAGRSLDGLLAADEWSEMTTWPASTCEGAFVREPKNAGLVRQIERVVAR